ncbi:MAG: cytidine deaminase [Clostridium sp.]|uniref:cytidine deaminase n=1 Tax=Clostridium sp. TaxID=1506 RepID=UPI002FC5C020
MLNNKDLVESARKAMEYSYSPYSKFRVGAALLSLDGKVFTGCNIENASFGGTNCAERTALFKAVSEGNLKFSKIAIISDSEDYISPCGICRQVLAEFGLDMDVIMAKLNGEYKVMKVRDLLPLAFTGEDL